MKIKNFEVNIYTIQENGLFSTPMLGEGRFIPALVVKSIYDNKLKELVKIHQETPPGDTVTYWSIPARQFFNTKKWHLHIEFSQPMEYIFQIEFNLEEDYSLIDCILLSQALYLGFGDKGQKVSTLREEMILLEVPDHGVSKIWEKTIDDVIKKILKKIGTPKKQLKDEIRKHKSEMRKILLLNRNKNN